MDELLLPFDPGLFFSTDPAHGALRDRNGDGFADDLRVRIVVEGAPSAAEWVELVHLAARLGLESDGFTPPLALAAGSPPPDTLPLVFRPPTDTPAGAAIPSGPVVQGVAAVRALWRHGLDAGGAAAPVAAAPSERPLDLAALYEGGGRGTLADDDGDLFPERVRLCPVVPPALPVVVGLALLDLAARLGVEATGLRFPLAAGPGDVPPPDAVPLIIALGAAGLGGIRGESLARLPAPGPGAGLCAVVEHDRGGPALLVRGDEAGVARTLRALAAVWPCLDRWEAGAPTAADVAVELVAFLCGETDAGRAARLAAGVAALPWGDSGDGGVELRLLDDRPALVAAARDAVAAGGHGLAVVPAPDDLLAFVDEWRDEWEVDRARRLVREQVLPALVPDEPVELLVMVSEPQAVRRALAGELGTLGLPRGSRVLVLDACKPGLCWLREAVAPAWAARGDVARVELRFRPFSPPPGETFLDLPIRWLQELYPGDEILAGALGLPLAAVTIVTGAADDADTYRAAAFDAAGQEIDARTFSPRAYTRPYLHERPEQGLVTVTTGAVVATRRGDRRVLFDERLPTDFDRFWAYYQETVLPRLRVFIEAETGGLPTAAAQPFFAALDVEVWCSETDEELGIREERHSAAEALHEDIYFGTLDYVAALGPASRWSGTLGGDDGEALEAPGAVRPFVHLREGTGPGARITLRRRLRHLAEVVPEAGSSARILVGALPTGPRPAVAVRWALCQPDVPGFARLGLALTGADERAAAVLTHASAGVGSASTVLDINLAGVAAPIAIALPHPAREMTAAPPAAAPAPLTPLDEVGLRPQLARLAALPGVTVRQVGRSFEGRPIAALEVLAPPGGAVWSRRKASLRKPTALIVARHHANEPASTPAALELAERCATDPAYRPFLDRVNLVLLPLENPDGAALHGVMAAEHPRWKLHAARYNAAGFEFARDFHNPETPWGEARPRPALWRQWLPDVVVDNHGVPSHEWQQLFNGGGSPPGFGPSYWLVPALVYGILRYPEGAPAHLAFAEAVRDRIAAAVAAEPDLAAANRVLHERYAGWGHRHVPARFPASYHRDMLWFFGPRPGRTPQPMEYDRITSATFVTEVADETAQDDYLALVARGHLVANRAVLRLLASVAPPVTRHVAATPGGLAVLLRRQRPLSAGAPGAE